MTASSFVGFVAHVQRNHCTVFARQMANRELDLARQVDAAQSILDSAAAAQARRLEGALARSSRAVVAAQARLDPGSGAGSRELCGGMAIFAGKGSPLTQGLAMGLGGPVTAAELDALEAFVRPDGKGARQLELCPFAHPTLPALLAARGYRVHEWQLAWVRERGEPLPAAAASELSIRRVEPGQERRYFHAVLAGFLESEAVPEAALAMLAPTAHAEQHELYLAWLGDEPIGGAALSWADGVAILSGSGVRPAFRRRGAQAALIRARLERASALGCELVYSNTLPGTSSRRNMERYGFHVAYPKLVMLADA
jgi:GNAT superfamily N-acetyltransferase